MSSVGTSIVSGYNAIRSKKLQTPLSRQFAHAINQHLRVITTQAMHEYYLVDLVIKEAAFRPSEVVHLVNKSALAYDSFP